MPACTAAPADKCHYFLGTGDPKNMPVARQDLMRAVYRRYFTFAGKHFPKLVGAVDLTKDVLTSGTPTTTSARMPALLVFCPYGIDTAEITMAAREIMDAVGLGQKYSNEIIGKVHRIGNNLGLPGPALEDTLLGLEEDVKGRHRRRRALPARRAGRRGAAHHAQRRFLRRAACREPDRLRQGLPCRRHQLDASSSKASEAGNFGMFIGNYEQLRKIALRIREAALELGVKRIVVGECGHAWRVAYSFWNTLVGIGAGGITTRSPSSCRASSTVATASPCTSAS